MLVGVRGGVRGQEHGPGHRHSGSCILRLTYRCRLYTSWFLSFSSIQLYRSSLFPRLVSCPSACAGLFIKSLLISIIQISNMWRNCSTLTSQSKYLYARHKRRCIQLSYASRADSCSRIEHEGLARVVLQGADVGRRGANIASQKRADMTNFMHKIRADM